MHLKPVDLLDDVRVNAETIALGIGLVYFVAVGRTDEYGTDGARVELAVSPHTSKDVLDLLSGQTDRDILSFDFDLRPPTVHLSIMDTSIWRAHDFRLSFDTDASQFAWILG